MSELDKLWGEFDRCWPWLEASLEPGAYIHDGKIWPTHNRLQVWERLASGRALLWPGETCAIVTEFLNHPTGLKSHNTWMAGGIENACLDEIKWMMQNKVEPFGYQNGCHRQVGFGRKGWLRVFTGYVECGTRKQKDLLAAV